MSELKDFFKSRRIVNLIFVSLNVIIFFLLEVRGDTESATYMAEHGAFYLPWVLEYGEYYRFVTCMFLHFGLEHLFNNMLVLLFLGDTLEKTVGKVRYFIIYMMGGIAGNVLSAWKSYQMQEYSVSAGASGAVFAVIGALIFQVIVHKGKLEGIEGKQLILMAVLTLFQGFTSIGVDNWAHVGGLIGGFLLAVILFNWWKKEE